MCRVFMCNKTFFQDNNKVLPNLWYGFVKTNGGDGNGVACYAGPDYHPLILKGVKQTVWESFDACKKWAKLDECEWLLFHTRMATSGGITDAMCHPFEEDGDLLIHNGVCSEFADFQINRQDVSDTRMLFYLARNYSKNFYETIYNGSGAFLGVRNGVAYAIKASQSAALVCLYNAKNGGLAWCSTWSLKIPDGYKIYSTKLGIWIQSQPIVPTNGKTGGILLAETTRTFANYLSTQEYDDLNPSEQSNYYLCETVSKDGKKHQYYMYQNKVYNYSGTSTDARSGWNSQDYWDKLYNGQKGEDTYE